MHVSHAQPGQTEQSPGRTTGGKLRASSVSRVHSFQGLEEQAKESAPKKGMSIPLMRLRGRTCNKSAALAKATANRMCAIASNCQRAHSYCGLMIHGKF